MNSDTRQRLRNCIERIERGEEEKQALAQDIRHILAQAKSEGFDVKIMRQVLRVRKMDPDERAEAGALLDTYMHALEAQLDMFKERENA